MEEKRLRVALFGRLYFQEEESLQSQKEKLRMEARRRNYIIVDEFWEENLPLNTPLDERPEMKRFIKSVWMNELDIEGIFLSQLSSLSWCSRKEHVTLMMFFEQNNITIITPDAIYDPNDWMSGLSF